jgi:hypothetical protein
VFSSISRAGWLGFFLALSPWASSEEAADCAKRGASLGAGVSARGLDRTCAQAVFNRAPASQSTTSPYEKFSAAGFQNLVSLVSHTGTDKYDFISGPNTGLNAVESIALSPTRKEVWILNRQEDGSKDLRVFISRYGGNLSPIRVYAGPELSGSSLIQVDRAGEEVALWFPEQKTVKIMGIGSLPGGKDRTLVPKWSRSFSIPMTDADSIEAFTWVSHKKMMAMVSLSQSQVSVFREPAAVGPASLVEGPIRLPLNPKPVRVYWSEKSEGLQSVFQDGSTSLLRMDP